MDSEHLREVVPHYIAMILLLLIVFSLVPMILGEENFWIEMAVGLVVVFAYRPIVLRLGVAPDSWEEQARQRRQSKE